MIGETHEAPSFLKSALTSGAALLPAAGLKEFALAQAAAAPAASGLHVVGSGLDRFEEAHSRGFSNILFKVAAHETGGSLFIIEHTNLVKGGPPRHLHPYQEEWFYVIEGEVLFQVGGDRKKLRTGESVLAPRNVPHAFTLASEQPGRLLIAFTPAGKVEEFFRATAIPNPPHEDAELFRRYDMEFIGPSPFAV